MLHGNTQSNDDDDDDINDDDNEITKQIGREIIPAITDKYLHVTHSTRRLTPSRTMPENTSGATNEMAAAAVHKS